MNVDVSHFFGGLSAEQLIAQATHWLPEPDDRRKVSRAVKHSQEYYWFIPSWESHNSYMVHPVYIEVFCILIALGNIIEWSKE